MQVNIIEFHCCCMIFYQKLTLLSKCFAPVNVRTNAKSWLQEKCLIHIEKLWISCYTVNVDSAQCSQWYITFLGFWKVPWNNYTKMGKNMQHCKCKGSASLKNLSVTYFEILYRKNAGCLEGCSSTMIFVVILLKSRHRKLILGIFLPEISRLPFAVCRLPFA